MSIEKFDSNFENLIRKSLEDFEYPYDETQWARLEKKLPGKNPFSPLSKAALIVTAFLLLGVAGYYSYNAFVKENGKEETNTVNTGLKPENNNGNIQDQQPQSVNPKSNVFIAADQNPDNRNTNPANYTNNVVVQNVYSDPERHTQVNIQNNPVNNQNPNNPLNQNPVSSDKPSVNGIPMAMIALAGDEGCAPFTLSCNAVMKNDSMQYTWDFGDGTESYDFAPNHTYNIPGNYFISLVVKNKFTQAVASNLYPKPINVKSSPVADFTYVSQGGGHYQFTSTSTGADQFQWAIGNEVLMGATPTYEFLREGNYNVTHVVSNKAGCNASVTRSVKVDIAVAKLFPNSFTPDGDGLNDYYCPKLEGDFSEFKMLIYNRGGKLIFESSDINNCWDGYDKSSGKKCEEGAYPCKIFYKDKAGQPQTLAGSITLLIIK